MVEGELKDFLWMGVMRLKVLAPSKFKTETQILQCNQGSLILDRSWEGAWLNFLLSGILLMYFQPKDRIDFLLPKVTLKFIGRGGQNGTVGKSRTHINKSRFLKNCSTYGKILLFLIEPC